ncbi:hypothetical protein JVU11DRAFT_5653 [Chiua virens]|nr:hypothetical protein JVU11DRAFT_5653 [Chiua virens]
MQILSAPPPTAAKMDEYLVNIAQMYNVKWVPELRGEALLNVILDILRMDAGSSPIVDLPRLRELCGRGISFVAFSHLSLRFLPRLTLSPRPTRCLPEYPIPSSEYPQTRSSSSETNRKSTQKCPLDPSAPEDIRISCASNLDKRLALLRGDSDTCDTPEIRLESELNGSADPSSPSSSTGIRRQHRPTTLLPSKAYNAPPAHRAHLSSLLRLLYLHSTLNPAVQSPHVPWLLVPLYSALVGETDEDEVAHAEADTFWVFEALVGEIAELEEEDGGKIWRRKLSERIKWVDGDLATQLHATGLDPILPHYSYPWLAPLLTQTLPLSSVFPVWDVVFARPMRTRDVNPKLEYLVDICTALLVRARTPLFRLGKPAGNAPGIWTQEQNALTPFSPLRPWELSDAFTEGIALLKSYPIDAVGGIDRVLQTAVDFARKRVEEREKEKERERESVGFGVRIRQQMWKGFTNQVAEAEEEEEKEEEEEEEEDTEEEETEEHDDGNETETPAAPTLASRLANTVWRGITNQSSMDDEVPSPPSPSSARQSPTPPEEEGTEGSTPTPTSQASLWNYAGKLKDSDTVAAFSKVSTNWRAKALDAWRVRKDSNASASSVPMSPGHPTPPSSASEVAPRQSGWPGISDTDPLSHRRGSLPGTQRETFFHYPRRQYNTAPSSPKVDSTARPLRDSDTESNSSSVYASSGCFPCFPYHAPVLSSTPKNVPRPLMLSSRDRITTKSPQLLEGGTLDNRGGVGEWGEVISTKKGCHTVRQASVSSTSSLSPSEALNRSPRLLPTTTHARSVGTGQRSDYDSDGSTASRKVPLNRKSVSPMALASRSPHLPWNASPSGGGRSTGHPLSNGSVTAEDMETGYERGWRHFEEQTTSATTCTTTGFDSPTTIGSPRTPLMPAIPGPGVIRIVNGGHVGTNSISTLSEASEVNVTSFEPSTQSRHGLRKKTPPLPVQTTSPDDSDEGTMPISALESEASELSLPESVDRTPLGKAPARLRSKRHVSRPAHLRLRPTWTGTAMGDQRTPSPKPRSLGPEHSTECDPATTPKMGDYSGRNGKEADVEGGGGGVMVPSKSPVVRNVSKEGRVKKVPTEGRRMRDSGAEEGDDELEGYDDLLSAYESEEGSRE